MITTTMLANCLLDEETGDFIDINSGNVLSSDEYYDQLEAKQPMISMSSNHADKRPSLDKVIEEVLDLSLLNYQVEQKTPEMKIGETLPYTLGKDTEQVRLEDGTEFTTGSVQPNCCDVEHKVSLSTDQPFGLLDERHEKVYRSILQSVGQIMISLRRNLTDGTDIYHLEDIANEMTLLCDHIKGAPRYLVALSLLKAVQQSEGYIRFLRAKESTRNKKLFLDFANTIKQLHGSIAKLKSTLYKRRKSGGHRIH